MIYHQVCFVLFFVLVLFGNLPSFTSAKILTMSKFPQGIMMKCTKDGKLMKSIDDGFTWNEISVSLPASLAATSAVDAFFTSIASDATGENLIASSKNQGVFVSHDSGGSWQLVAGLDSSLSWMGVSSDAIGENLAALAPNGGIYFSNDHGRSWKESSSAPKTNEWRSIVSDRTGQYLTATSENDGIFTSFDYGVNWVKAQTPAHVKKWNDITVDFSGQYLAAVAPSHGIYHSMDHGLTWVALSVGDTSSAQEWKSIASGRTGQFLAAVTAEGKIFVSGDYGNHWKHASNFPLDEKLSQLVFDSDGTHLFAMTEKDEAVYYSSNVGTTWTTRYQKIANVQLDAGIVTKPAAEAFDALFHGYKDFVPKIDKDNAMKGDSGGEFKELFENYQANLVKKMESSSPTLHPSAQPSGLPTGGPSSHPSVFPTGKPSAQPVGEPTSRPSAQPFAHPSSIPSGQPTSLPSAQPFADPTSQPSSKPTHASYAVQQVFNLTQTLNGISASDFQSDTNAKNAFLNTVQTFILVKPYVDSVNSLKIAKVQARDTSAQVSVTAATDSIYVFTTIDFTLSKWFRANDSFAAVQAIYSANVSSGAFAAALQSSSVPSLSSVTAEAPQFGVPKVNAVNTPVPSSRPSSQPSTQPSRAPSGQPSSQPTSQPSRDLTKVVPTVAISLNTSTSTSVRLQIKFTGETVYYKGTVYCGAFLTTTSVTATNYVSQLQLNGIAVSFAAGATSLAASLTGLTPSTSYTAYCVVQNLIGLTTTYSDMTAGAVTVSTQCCKAITFTTAPSFLYNYFTLYSLSANAGKNVYTLRLGSLPSSGKSLTLTPKFSAIFNSSNVRFSPATVTFTSTSTSLIASFSVLTFNNTLTTTGTSITLVPSGTASAEFGTISTSVAIISSGKIPAPNMVTAQISNDGSSLSIAFDGNTNYGGKTAATSFKCSDLFSFSYFTVTGITDTTTCVWVTAASVTASFPSGALPNIFADTSATWNKVNLLGGLIKAVCTTPDCVSSTAPAATISMLAPTNPASPNIVLSVPSFLSGCTDLTIDASASTGNLGRQWSKVAFSVASANVAVDGINAILSTYDDTKAVITIASSKIASTTYYLTLSLTNVFGKSSSVTVPFAKSANTNIPSASIAGPSTVITKAKSTLSLTAVGAVSPCGVANSSLSYAWRVSNSSGNTVPVTSTSRTTSIFSLRSYALSSGAIYTVTLTVTSSDGTTVNTASASASVTVQVKSGDVVGKIAGSHTLLSSQDLTLDASGSYDENVAPGGSSSLSYQWSCASLDAATYGSDCTSEALAGSTLTNPTLFVNYTNLFPSRSYSFVVVASSGSRSGTDAVTVNTVSFSSKDAQIRASAAISSSLSTTTTVNQFQALSIQASISSSIKSKVAISKALVAQWIGFFSDETDTFDVQSVTSLRSVNATLNVTSRTPLVNYAFPLTIKASSFEAGSQVTFRLSLFSDGSAVSYSDITYNVVSNPSGGAFAVSPTAGVALSTLFSLRCFGWNDDASNLPLSYDFRYSWGSGLFTIQSSSLLNFASTALPAGTDNDLGGNITLISRVFNVYGGFQSISVPVKVLKTDSSSGGQSQAISNYLKNSLSSSTKSGNTEAIVATVSIVGNTLNSVNCTLATATRCASLNRKQCATTPQTCGSCLSGFSGIFGPSNTRCSARRNRGRRVLTASDSVQSAAETACATDDDCEFGTCNLQTGFCLVPPKDCVSNCNGNGVCAYSNINGQAMNRSDCAVDNTFCLATCSCSTGFYGIDCSLTQADYEQRESSRALMCSSLASVIQSSNPSSNLIDSMASALTAAYNSYEVLTEEGRDSCFQLIEGIVGLAQAGYLTVEQLPDTTGETTTATQNLWNSVSSFIKIGDTTSLNSIVTSFTDAVMSLLASGQSDVQFLSDNLKLSFNKIRFSDVIEQEFTIPQSDSESNYGTVTPTITFTSNDPNEIINSCSVFDSPDPTQLGTAINNANNYFTFAYGSWNANPFAQAGDYDTVVVRTQAYTNNTVTTKEVYDVPLYYISYPFTSSQEFQNFSRMSKEERSLYNQSFPVCSEYFWKNSNQDYLPSICSSCNVSTYDNTSVTFACFDMQSFCGAPNAREIDGTITSITSDRRQLASAGDNVNQFGAMVKSVGASAVGFSYNNFKIDVNAAIPILIAVGGIVLLILIGLVYFYQWDINDYYIVKYSNRIKYNYTSMIFDSSPVDATRAGQMLLETDDGKDDETIGGKKTTAYGSILKSVGFGDKFQSIIPGGDSKAVGTSSSDILYILHNAFPAVVYQSAEEGERGSLGRNRNSTATNATSKSFYEALTRNDYLNMFKSQNYYYHRFIKWVQVMIQVITILFINTLFFYIFYPDRGQCEDYKTEGDCLYHKNLITQNYLCQWSSDGVLVKDVTCELRPPQLSVPFIMLLSTVTIMIAMPLVIGWNVLFMDLCATIPPAWYQFLLGDNEPQQAVAVTSRGREHVEGEEGDEKEDEDAEVHAEESSNRYAVSRHAQRINRKPLPEGARKGTGGRGSSVMGEDERSGTVISSELFYVNRIPVEEEMDVLFQAIQRFYHQLDHQSSTSHHNYHGVLSPIQAKMLYIYYSLGIDSNFHTVPLSLRQQLKYGSLFASPNDHTVKYRNVAGEVAADMTIHHAAYQRIKNKLSQSRFESEEFVRFFANQAKNNTSSNDPVKERDVIMMNNIQLLQFFIFEQFPIYQKYLLYYFFHHTYLYSNLHLFNSLPSDMKASHNSVLNMIAWVFKSLVLLGGIAFSVYFILNWSIVSNDNTFASWGINYIIIVVEQLFIIQWIQHFYVQNIISSLLLPKLQVIYSMIYQKLVQLASVPAPRVGSVAFSKGLKSAWPSTYSLGLSSAWPGMSYYSTATGLKDDASTNLGDLGGWKDEFPVSQLLSPVARACKTTALTDNLVISRMVNSFTDADMVNLKSQLSDMSTQYIIESNNKSFWSRGRPLSGAASVVEGREEAGNESGEVNSTYYKEVSEWKQYSFFHLLFIMLPLFIIQGMFQGLFSVLPFLSSSFYSKNFVLNSFHMVYFNMLFSYIVPGLISLLVIVAYYFCISVPLPAFIIVTLVVLFLVFYMTPKRNEQFFQFVFSCFNTRSTLSRGSPRRGFSSYTLQDSFSSYLTGILVNTLIFIFYPLYIAYRWHRRQEQTSHMVQEQWQIQNLPNTLVVTDKPEDSYFMSLVANHHLPENHDVDLPHEVKEITNVSSLLPTMPTEKEKKRSPNKQKSYFSSLLDQTNYDSGKYEEYLLSKYHVRDINESLDKRISSTNYTASTAGHSDYGANDESPSSQRRAVSLFIATSENNDELDPQTIHTSTITSVRQLRFLVEQMLGTSSINPTSPTASVRGGVGGSAAVGGNYHHYNFYYQITDNYMIALLRAMTMVFFESEENTNALSTNRFPETLERIYQATEEAFSTEESSVQVTPRSRTVLKLDATAYSLLLERFFTIFAPILSTGTTLTTSERTEIVNDFYQFIIMNDFSWESISFPAFLQWFRLMMDKIVKYKTILQYGSGSSTSGNSQGSGNAAEKAAVEGGGSSNGDDDKTNEVSGERRGKYQYQMNYQRLQRAVMTDASSINLHAPEEEGKTDSSHVKASRSNHPESTGAVFSSPRRVPVGGVQQQSQLHSTSNDSEFIETNPLRSTTSNKKKTYRLDLSSELSQKDEKK